MERSTERKSGSRKAGTNGWSYSRARPIWLHSRAVLDDASFFREVSVENPSRRPSSAIRAADDPAGEWRKWVGRFSDSSRVAGRFPTQGQCHAAATAGPPRTRECSADGRRPGCRRRFVLGRQHSKPCLRVGGSFWGIGRLPNASEPLLTWSRACGREYGPISARQTHRILKRSETAPALVLHWLARIIDEADTVQEAKVEPVAPLESVSAMFNRSRLFPSSTPFPSGELKCSQILLTKASGL